MTFVDIGSGRGNSILMASKLWGGDGIGYETSLNRNAEAIERGYDCRLESALDALPKLGDGCFDYAVINHFLEHLAGTGEVRTIIQHACRVTSGFVFVAGPWFDSDGPLFRRGLKIFASDWPEDHPTRVTMMDLYRAFQDFMPGGTLKLYGRQPITSTDHHYLFPIQAVTRGLKGPYHYDPEQHGAKPAGEYIDGCFWEVCAIAYRPGNESAAERFEENQEGKTTCLTTQSL